MTTLALLLLQANFTIVRPRFVYVDPTGHVRLYGSPMVRSSRGHARQPDLSPDGRRFVYWVETDSRDGAEPMVEHEIASGKERVLRRGNLRCLRYAADGRTIFFTETFGGEWSLLALDRATGRGRLVLKPWRGPQGLVVSEGDRVGSLSDPAPQADGTVAIHDGSRALRVSSSGKVVWSGDFDSVAGEADPDLAAPAPDHSDRLLVAHWTTEADSRIVGTDGTAGGLWLYDARTMKGRRITPLSVGAMRPCWTRDGKAILFHGGPLKGRTGIWSIRPDGTGRRFLVPGDEPSAGVQAPSSKTAFSYSSSRGRSTPIDGRWATAPRR